MRVALLLATLVAYALGQTIGTTETVATNDDAPDEDHHLSPGMIVGITLGCIDGAFFVGLFGFLIYKMIMRSRRRGFALATDYDDAFV
eukprot:m.14557 g.14557  ORF g.14557 m.14557 type:complete len:88 (+) comp2946_c0_seq2:61-324(+)